MYLFPNRVTLLPGDRLSLPWAALTLPFDSSGHWAGLALLCFFSLWIMGQILIFPGQYWEMKGQKLKAILAAQAHPWHWLSFNVGHHFSSTQRPSHILSSQVGLTVVMSGLGPHQIPSCSCGIPEFGVGEEAVTRISSPSYWHSFSHFPAWID